MRRFFQWVSNVRPIIWIGIYILLVPVFAFIYWALPDSQFRIPDNAGIGYGSWLYYSIVTITTLGFGDYTPAHIWAQTVTAIEVICGLAIFGFFLNAVAALKSEIAVESEVEKQRKLHQSAQEDMLVANTPVLMHQLNTFLSYCYAVTTPHDRRKTGDTFNEDFEFSDMRDLYKPSAIPIDHTIRPAVEGFLKCAYHTCLYIDTLQSKIDLSVWPQLLEDCFSFVANLQMFSAADNINGAVHLKSLREKSDDNKDTRSLAHQISEEIANAKTVPVPEKGNPISYYVELFELIKTTGRLAKKIEADVAEIAVTTQHRQTK